MGIPQDSAFLCYTGCFLISGLAKKKICLFFFAGDKKVEWNANTFKGKIRITKSSKSLNQSAHITEPSLSVVKGRLCFGVLKI